MAEKEYIDREWLLNEGIRVTSGYNNDGVILIPMRDVRESIKNAPAADVVEVVRCKDCLFNKFTQPNGTIHCHVDCNDIRFRNPNDFCSYGKRKENPMSEAEKIIGLIFDGAERFEAIIGRKPTIFMSRDILGDLVNGMGRKIVETDKCGVNHIGEYELKITRGVCELYVGFELKFEKRKENDHESKTENDF